MDKAWTTPSAASPLFGRQGAGRGAPSGRVRFGRAGAVHALQRNIALFMQPSPADAVPRMPGWSDLAMTTGRFEKGDVPIVADPSRLAVNRAMFRSRPIDTDAR